MAILTTQITDLVPSEKAMADQINLLLPAGNELVTSNIAASSEIVTAAASSGPRKVSIPFLKPLSTAEYNISGTDLTVAGASGKLEAKEFSALRHDINYAWGTSDLADMVTQYSAAGGIGAGVAQYWNGIYQKIADNSITGALGANAGLTVGDDTAALDVDMIVDAAATGEMYADLFDTLIVSPTTKAKLIKLNAGNSFVPAAAANTRFDTFAGYKLIVSTAFGNTMSVLCRSGALAFGDGTPADMASIEVERVANGGNGRGGNLMHSRRSVVIHPQGFSWTGASNSATVTPSLAQLATAGNWALAPDVTLDQIGFRAIEHT